MRMMDYRPDLDLVLGGVALDRFVRDLEDGRTVTNSLRDIREQYDDGCCEPPAPVGAGSGVVTFLVDQSNSLSLTSRDAIGQLIIDFLDEAALRLEAGGIPFEVIGHTTPKWKGGDTFRSWDAAGRPEPEEGTFWRLNEVLVMVHKAASEHWGGIGRGRLASTLAGPRSALSKENVDQIAFEEATVRQHRMGATERTVVLIGDLVPADDATIMNGPRRAEVMETDFARVIGKSVRDGTRVVGIEIHDDRWPEASAIRSERLGIPVLPMPRPGDGLDARLAAFVADEFAPLLLPGTPSPSA